MQIGKCVDEALEVYKKNLAVLVIGAVIFDVLSLISLTILMGPLAGGWCVMTLNALRDPEKRIDLGDMFRAFHKFFRLMGLFYLTLLCMIVGFVLCVIPGFLLMTIWIFSLFLIVDRDEGVFSSLGRSSEIVTRGGFGNYVALMLIVFAISIAPNAIPYVGFVIAWFLMPIAWLIEAAAYVQEMDEKKP